MDAGTFEVLTPSDRIGCRSYALHNYKYSDSSQVLTKLVSYNLFGPEAPVQVPVWCHGHQDTST